MIIIQWSLCKKDRDGNLNNLITKNDKFECKIWATIMKNTTDLIKENWFLSPIIAGAVSALSNQYCYMGISNNKLYISVVKTLKVKEENYNLVIPFNEIQRVKIKGLIPKRKVVILYFKNKKKMKTAVMLNAIGSDIKDQKENALKFLELISTVNN